MPKESAEGTSPEGETQTPSSPTEPSEGLGLASGLPAGFFDRDDPANDVTEPEVTETPPKPAEKETVEPAVEEPEATEGEPVAPTPMDADLVDLQRKYAESETERLRRAEEQHVMQEQLKELQPLLDLGNAVRQDPALYKDVVARLRGEGVQAPTQKQAAKMTPNQFMDLLVQRVVEAVVPEVEDRVTRASSDQRAAERKFNAIDAKANKEIDNFDVISRHPKFLRYVRFYTDALMDPNNPWNPGKDDPQFWAVKQAADAVMKDNPDYIKALTDSAVKKAAVKAEKKAAAASIGKSSKTVPQKKRKLTEDEQDRLSMVQSRMRRGGGRRLPSAR